MGGTGVIDRFLEVFTRYIDSGFGLLGGEVAFLATTLIVIDVTLAALFWAWGADDDIIARLVKKTLFIGVFAYIISNWNTLARIVFESFAGLGLKATGTGFTTADLLRPGRVAQVGLDAGRPILDSISDLMGYISFFENFMQIIILMFAWGTVLLAFFILAIQLFITLIEFKLTTLAGFILIPFGLFGKTAFLAERVLGNVVSSGVKILVLAVIIGIGSTLFAEFTAGFGGNQPNIEDAMAIVLAALSLLGLGIFGPGIANGLISGGPQLGAGAAIGTGVAAAGVTAAAVAGTGMAGGAVAKAAMAGARGGAAMTGGTSAAYSLGSAGKSGAAGVAGGLGGVARAGAGVAASPLKKMAGAMRDSARSGARTAIEASGGTISGGAGDVGAATSSSAQPAWAKRMKRSQSIQHGATAAAHAVRSGDSHGGGASINLSERDS
ncbi:P-type conjugative transfer protein TrbL [Mesorhizobium sp. NBSH29]|uniref:P-type conjugative transfer protein TrbL n=1 Tax=Mesorhizobium sp. NBSH29 TaxID=2654249 RepID=UPI00189671F2|nr:P-type conjugative transfer protein TrbL [Mesorhizobium sp. NBSH29]QPC86423.1 P-type conjugative transfer protein TrbL [Mesorhizobium sp. NBSH29]